MGNDQIYTIKIGGYDESKDENFALCQFCSTSVFSIKIAIPPLLILNYKKK
jgi:hypothetical protein